MNDAFLNGRMVNYAICGELRDYVYRYPALKAEKYNSEALISRLEGPLSDRLVFTNDTFRYYGDMVKAREKHIAN
jgi:hypothetical protein